MLIDESEPEPFFKRNIKFLQPCQVLIFACASAVMLFLILNVMNNCAELRMPIRTEGL